MRTSLVLIGITLLGAGSLHSQTARDSAKHRNECRLARQVIETGHPAPHLRWSLGYIASCGAGAQASAVAHALRRLRTEADTAVLRPYWRVTQFLTDRTLFEVAEEIATDRTASVAARTFAILGLLNATRERSTAEYENLIGGFRPDGLVAGGCAAIQVSGRFRNTGTPLPGDYRQRVAAVRQRIQANPSEPLDVRTAAACL